MTFGDSRTMNISPVRKPLKVLLIHVTQKSCSKYKQSLYLSKYVIPVVKVMLGCQNRHLRDTFSFGTICRCF